jgi:hypothetical protein
MLLNDLVEVIKTLARQYGSGTIVSMVGLPRGRALVGFGKGGKYNDMFQFIMAPVSENVFSITQKEGSPWEGELLSLTGTGPEIIDALLPYMKA